MHCSLSCARPTRDVVCPGCPHLHCIALHRTALHRAAPHCTAVHCIGKHGCYRSDVIHHVPDNDVLLHCIVLHRTALYCTAPRCIALRCTRFMVLHRARCSHTVVQQQQQQLCCASGCERVCEGAACTAVVLAVAVPCHAAWDDRHIASA